MHALLPGLTRANLGTEVLAGITLLAIALPLNIGYAQIAGLPPTAGLMSQIYEEQKDEDGFLYITYNGESVFGA